MIYCFMLISVFIIRVFQPAPGINQGLIKPGYFKRKGPVSGSGPAYLFYLADAVLSAAEKQGLDKQTAKKLVHQTLYGAAVLLNKSDISAAELVKKVASKGGTTEAALSVFRERDLKGIIEEAVEKAKKRSEELSGG